MKMKSNLLIKEYEIFFDGQKEGYHASGGSAILSDGQVHLHFQKASDAEAGLYTYLTKSLDFGKTWTRPQPFGPDIIKNPEKEFMGIAKFGPSKSGTIFSVGVHLKKGVDINNYQNDINWRPGTVIIGRMEKDDREFEYQYYASGTFLGEQFVAPGIILSSGRILLTIWGSKSPGENWRCGVLISDDDGLTWKYSEVGYVSDFYIRNSQDVPAGFNEQSLFETEDGDIVSLIRGRDKLGIVEGSKKDTWFLRSVSKDNGDTWSEPENTDIAGTGAASYGITLPDGSLLHACRIPYSREMYVLPNPELFGLHLARSYDKGKTWNTELMKQSDPEGNPFNNYYNTMNGQFISIDEYDWMYIFGQFDIERNIHRILKLRFHLVPLE